MSKIAYAEKRFSDKSLATIAQANRIIEEYMADGLILTLRQLYYQFVANGLIANKQSEYKRLGNLISEGRLSGLVDWRAIEDRTRELEENSHWRDPGHIMQNVVSSFRTDHWHNQEYHPEVWIEKEALVGVIDGICKELDVPYFACKGYVSQSEMWVAAQRFDDYKERGQVPVVIHLGDHDPSGMDMTRDIVDRQETFQVFGCEVERIALNMDQIEIHSPPPNPVKFTDSRCEGYVALYGRESWELDALEPRTLRDLIRETVLSYRDEEIYGRAIEEEKKYLSILRKVEDHWEEI